MRSRVRWLAAAGAVSLLVAVAGGWWTFQVLRRLDQQLVERFEGKRWEIPSKIYSDSFAVYVGRQVSPLALVERLDHLDYRRVDGEPSTAGEYRYRPSERRLEVYLRDFAYPIGARPGYLTRWDLSNEAVAAITRLDTGQSVESVELEPEILAGIFEGMVSREEGRLHIRRSHRWHVERTRVGHGQHACVV